MNSLEFIENEMECCEIDFVLAQKREDKILIRHFKERYEQLKQIKAKLEAWEVVEEEIEYNKEKACSERPDIVYSFEHWTFEINEDQSDFEEKSTKLKKALEVEKNII